MRRLGYVVVIIVFCYSYFATGCFFLNREEQNEYHEQVEELERHITDELGDYIVIDNYDPDVYTLPSAGFRGKIAAWNFSFKKKYIEDDTKTKQHTPISIIERVRSLYNEYVNEHAEYALNNYVVEIFINVPRSHKPPYEWYAVISNWDWENCQPSGKELSTVRLFYPKPDDSYSFSFGEWDYYYDHQDIEIAQMDDDSTMDQIIEVADNMPYLKYIAVKDQDTADEASRLRPDMKFVGIS